MSNDPQLPDMSMDADGLYREEVFTDNKIGTLRRLTPVTASGDDDPSRTVRYAGQTQLMTPAGALPLNFEIEAATLGEAAERFGALAQQALEETMEELKELRRQAASSIVVPGAEGMGGGVAGGGMPGGGMPGGGKIKMP